MMDHAAFPLWLPGVQRLFNGQDAVWSGLVWSGRSDRFAANHALQAQAAHEPLDHAA